MHSLHSPSRPRAPLIESSLFHGDAASVPDSVKSPFPPLTMRLQRSRHQKRSAVQMPPIAFL